MGTQTFKERLQGITATAIDAENKRLAREKQEKQEKARAKVEIARVEAEQVIGTIEGKATKAAENKMFKADILKTDFAYALSNNRDINVDKSNLNDLSNSGLFSNLRDYMVVKYIVTELEMNVILEFRHDGMGVQSWYEIVMCW